ncbi:hypothetical protein C0995_002644, partial [Termitomyces sp. Mi166
SIPKPPPRQDDVPALPVQDKIPPPAPPSLADLGDSNDPSFHAAVDHVSILNICAQETQIITPQRPGTTVATNPISSSPPVTEKYNVGPKSITAKQPPPEITLKLEDSPPLPFSAAPNPETPSPVVSESKTKVLVVSAGVDYTTVTGEPMRDAQLIPPPSTATHPTMLARLPSSTDAVGDGNPNSTAPFPEIGKDQSTSSVYATESVRGVPPVPVVEEGDTGDNLTDDSTSAISGPMQDPPPIPVSTAATGLIRLASLSAFAENVTTFTSSLDHRLLAYLSTILTLALASFVLWSLHIIRLPQRKPASTVAHNSESMTGIVTGRPVEDSPAPVSTVALDPEVNIIVGTPVEDTPAPVSTAALDPEDSESTTVIAVRKPVKDPPAPVVCTAVEDTRAAEMRRRFSEPNITYTLAAFRAQLKLKVRKTVVEPAPSASASQDTTVDPHPEPQVTTLVSPSLMSTNNDGIMDPIPDPEPTSAESEPPSSTSDATDCTIEPASVEAELSSTNSIVTPVGTDALVEAPIITPSPSESSSMSMESIATESTSFESSSLPSSNKPSPTILPSQLNSESDPQVSGEISSFSSPPLSHLPPGRISTPRADFYSSPSQSFESYYGVQASEMPRSGRKRQLKRRHTTGRVHRGARRTPDQGYVRTAVLVQPYRNFELCDNTDEDAEPSNSLAEPGPSTASGSRLSPQPSPTERESTGQTGLGISLGQGGHLLSARTAELQSGPFTHRGQMAGDIQRSLAGL